MESSARSYRHGDVIIEATDEKPAGQIISRDKKGHVVLAEGEVTGHAHRIASDNCDLYTVPAPNNAPGNDNSVKLLVVRDFVDLSHEEHTTIRLPPGNYRIRVKRQYNAAGLWGNVAD